MPVFVGAVSFFHSVPNTPTLNLTGCTLAKIMNRQITSWDDDEITDLNPDLTIPSGGLNIRVARRVDGSSSTSGITNVSLIISYFVILLFRVVLLLLLLIILFILCTRI